MYALDKLEIKKELVPKYVGFEVELAGISTSSLVSLLHENNAETECHVDQDDSIKMVSTKYCASCRKNHHVVMERWGAELVSPKLSLDKVEPILTEFNGLMKTAKEHGACVNITTGTHVHIDGELFDATALGRTLEIFCSVEDAAYKIFVGDIDEPRVKYVDISNFARSMRSFMEITYKRHGTEGFSMMADKYWGWYVSRMDHRGNPRNTVEYRLFNGTMQSARLRSMIAFALGCSYMGIVGVVPEPPHFFDITTELDRKQAQAVRDIVLLGMRILEVMNG